MRGKKTIIVPSTLTTEAAIWDGKCRWCH